MKSLVFYGSIAVALCAAAAYSLSYMDSGAVLSYADVVPIGLAYNILAPLLLVGVLATVSTVLILLGLPAGASPIQFLVIGLARTRAFIRRAADPLSEVSRSGRETVGFSRR